MYGQKGVKRSRYIFEVLAGILPNIIYNKFKSYHIMLK